MALKGKTNAEKIWSFCKNKGLNDYGCAAVVGNADVESGLNPENLQDTYNRSLGMTDKEYVNAVDNGSYAKEQFAKDCAGFGFFQFTWWTRKQDLYDFWKSYGGSIGSAEVQLEFFWKELNKSYKPLLNTLKTSKSIAEASNAFMLKYECPYDQSVNAQSVRQRYAQKYYDQFATNGGAKELGYIVCTKGQKKQLSKNFTSIEFDCQGEGCCSQTKINEKLVEYVQNIRDHFGAPITITSGYRCETHNRNVGGATGSRHSKGDASDIVVKGVAPREVAKYAESIGILGIGLYETAKDGYFVHIDTRDYKSFWYGQAEEKRTTFGGSSSTSTGKPSSNTASIGTILCSGDRGDDVKDLQTKLIALGYSCGVRGADGDYGNSTRSAVVKFQRENNLDVDGIAGHMTITLLNELYNKLGNTSSKSQVKVTADILNVRSGAGTNYPVVGGVRYGQICEVIEERSGWGKINNPSGWIKLEYTVKK